MSSSFDPRITAYFGDAVLSAGFVAVPHLLLRHYNRIGMTSQQAMFMLQLMESTWDLAEPPRTSGELARRMGVDKRTIRRYSEELVALGLLALFDQFDEHGAQIGNGYDLSPLFARLAELAPEPRPDGASTRRPRPSPGAAPARVEEAATPGHLRPPLPRTSTSAPAPDIYVRPGADPQVHQGMIERSALNGKKTTKKQQQELLPAATLCEIPPATAAHPAGVSLRLGRNLDRSEVARSAELLRAMGIEQPVRGVIAPSLAPEEVWSLRLYAAARGWSTGLTIAQVYDRPSRCARAADDLPPSLDPLGRVLAALPDEQAAALLAELLRSLGGPAPPVSGTQPAVDAALRAAWPVLGGPTAAATNTARPTQVAARPDRHVAPKEADAGWPGELWPRVIERLSAQLPQADVATWIAGSRLLRLEDAEATIGAGNTFVRDYLDAHYRPLLEAALGAELGKPLSVQVVIE